MKLLGRLTRGPRPRAGGLCRLEVVTGWWKVGGWKGETRAGKKVTDDWKLKIVQYKNGNSRLGMGIVTRGC